MTVWLALLAAAATLNYWSRRGDPRFFAFLDSPEGAAIARIFGWWRSPLERPIPDRDESRMTRQERTIKDAIQCAVDGRADALTDGQSTETYRVRYRDVAFREEFADSPLYLYPPYAIISQMSAPDVDRTMRAVGDVYDAFRETFGPLLTHAPAGELIHLLYFGSEDAYLAYQRRYAGALEETSGFYSPSVNRLVLYGDQDNDDNLSLLTIRHEAAHQLFFAYGVHSTHRIENEWLIEGLASYCETPRVGGSDAIQVLMLRRALDHEALIPVVELVNHRNDRGLLAYKPAELAYAQAWCLVHLLMQHEHRERFFDYIRFLRAPASFGEVHDAKRIDILCRFLNLTPAQLQAEWEDHIRALSDAHRGLSPS